MSWLGGSLSSLTGQLSNLTKDILTEGTEEVSDHVTELRVAQEKLRELDTVCTSQRIELDRQKLLIREWEEKAEGSELQINKISREYRTLLQEKEGEIKSLKQLQHQHQELKSSYVSDDAYPALLQLEDDGFQSSGYGGDEHDFGDYITMQRDINRLRTETQSLQAQCQHWKSLVEKNKSTTASNDTNWSAEGNDSALHKQIQELQKQLETEADQRQQELSSLQDAHRHQVATLRKKHKQEVAQLQQKIQELDWGEDGWESQPSSSDGSLKQTVVRLQEELASLKGERETHLAKILELGATIEQQKSQSSCSDTSLSQTVVRLQEELSSLRGEREAYLAQITELGATIEQQKSQLSMQHAHTLHLENQLKLAKEDVRRLEEEKEKVGQDLFDTKQKLLDQLDANHADTLEVLSDLRQVRLHMDQSAVERRNRLLLEKDKIVNEIISSGHQKAELAESIARLESVQKNLEQETVTMVEEMGDPDSQEMTADIVHSLEKENLLLREKNVSLQEQVGLLEKAMHNLSKERTLGNRTVSEDSATLGGDDLDLHSDTMSFNSDMSELSRRNLELDEEVINLRAQIAKYESDISQFEELKADWQSEKVSLEEVLVALKGQLNTKEHSLSVLEAHKGLLAIEKHETNKAEGRRGTLEDIAEDVVELDSKIEQLTDANAQLEQERDLLVTEKAALQKELQSLKSKETDSLQAKGTEDNKKKLTDLTNELEEKAIELQALMNEKEDLEKNLSEVPTLKLQLQQKEDEVEQLKSNIDTNATEDVEAMEKEIADLQKKLRSKNEEIVNLSLEKQELMSSLEELDNQHEEAMSHIISIKEQISKSNDELKNKLGTSESEIQELKSELQKVRNQHLVNQTVESSSSNELNHEIAELKEENAELRNDVERSDSASAKLEIENAHLEKKIKELGDKCLSSASALNDLHMDKKEFLDEIQKLKAELSNQSLRIKDMRIQNEDLKRQVNSPSNDSRPDTDELQDIGNMKQSEEEYLKFQQDLEALEEKYLEEAEKCRKQEIQINELKEELGLSKKNCEVLKEESSRKREECESFSRQLHSLESQLSSMKEKECKDMNDLEAVKEKYLEEAEKCRKQDIQINEMKEELEFSKKNCEGLKKESSRKHEELESFSRQLHSLESQLSSMKKECKDMKADNESLISQVKTLNNELTLFRDNLGKKSSECEHLHLELEETKELLKDTTDRLHAKCEECTELSEEVEKHKNELSSSFEIKENAYEAKLMSATGEVVLVKEELSSTATELEALSKVLCAREEEVSSLKEINEELQETIKLLHSDAVELKSEKSSFEEAIDNCKAKLKESEANFDVIQSENSKLKNDLLEVGQKLTSQVQHYEAYVKELKSERQSDESSLQSQYDEAKEKCLKKDLEITDLKTALSDAEFRLRESTSNVEKVQLMHDTKDKEVIELQGALEVLRTSNDNLSSQLKESCKTSIELSEKNSALESELQGSKEVENDSLDFEKRRLNEKISELELNVENVSSQRKALQIAGDRLSEEVSSLQAKVGHSENELANLKEVNEAQEASIVELNHSKQEALHSLQDSRERLKSQSETVEQLKKSNQAKDEENSLLKQKLSSSKSFTTGGNTKEESDRIELVEVNEQMEMERTDNKLGMMYSNNENEFDSSKPDISVEIDNLRKTLREKDKVITDVQRNNASLLKMLDSKSKSSQGDSTIVEVHRLENEVKSLKIEKEQMIDVLNEKSRECSSLKAEVSKLMSIVSAEKVALQKLQQDNQELTRNSPENGEHISDMQKQVVQNLSRIIRDKDLEIESLTQKSQTLLSVLQESSNEDSHLHSLMQDKDNLTKQLATLQNEREQMISYLNQKHQESLAYHNEVQRLTAFMNTELEKTDKIKHEYESLMPQFEDKKQALVKTQNELIDYKQRYTDLELKYGQLLQQSNSEETVDKAVFESKVQEAKRLQERYKELMDSVKEKEAKLQSLHQNISELEQHLRTVSSEKSAFKKQVDSFTFQVHGLQTDQSEKVAEIGQLKKHRDELTSELQLMKELNNKLTMQLKDKDFEIQSLQRARTVIQGQVGNGVGPEGGEKGEVESLRQEAETAQKHMQQLLQERDQTVMALHQAQQQNEQLGKEVQTLKQKEAKMNRELDRLRQHLIQIEDGYTKEALSAEEREKDLRVRLANAEEKVFASSSAAESVNQQSSQQLDSLQQQLHFVSQQRDQAYLQLSSLQEQNQMYTVSMANLQMVLEEFQEEKEKMVAQETERLEKECANLKAQVQKLTTDLKYTKDQLEEASDGLEAAARLSEQLDRKEEAVDALKQEVMIREAGLKTVEEELHKLKSRSDDKVDKLVIKNLFLGYFTTPANQQREVLRAIGGILLFTSEDFERMEGRGRGSWVPGFLKFGGAHPPQSSPPTTPARRSTIAASGATSGSRKADNTFSEMFVRFLERESSPPPPTVRLPAEEMVRDVQKHKEKPPYNPFTAPRQVSAPPTSSMSSSTQNSQHILMSSAMSMPQTIPTFATPSQSSQTPPGSGRNTPASTTSGAILKDVLNKR